MRDLIRYLAPYIKGEWKAVLFGVVTVVFTAGFAALQPRIFGQALDSLMAPETTEENVLRMAGIILALALGQAVFRFLMRRTMIFASWRITYRIRQDVFAHLQKLHLGFYHSMRTGDIMSRATEDILAIRSVAGPAIMYTVNTTFTAVFVLFFMIQTSPRLTGFAMIPLLLTVLLVRSVGIRLGPAYRAVQDHMGEMSARIQDNLTGIRVVQTYGMEDAEIAAFQEMNEEHIKRNMRAVMLQGLMRPAALALIGSSLIVLMWQGGLAVMRGTLTIGELAEFDLYLIMLGWPAISVGWVLSLIQKGISAHQRLQAIYSMTPEISSEHAVDADDVKGEVTFDHVSLSFNEGRSNVLEDLSFTIPAGETWGIIGKVGAGKSSMVNLVARLYDVSEGRVLIDGHDVREYDLETLRKAIGFVPQETFLFSESIRRNVTFGDFDATEEEVDWAVQASQLVNDLDDFPQGLDTLLGERGINLSGGQKQRTAIARAILVGPRILILDDSLSAIDTHTEAEILRHLKEVRKGRTTLIISHRVSSLKDADRILVLEDGRLIEQGTHDALLNNGGFYAELYKKQLLEAELEQLA